MAVTLAMDTLAYLYSRLVLLAATTSGDCQVLSLQTPPKSITQLSTTVVLGREEVIKRVVKKPRSKFSSKKLIHKGAGFKLMPLVFSITNTA
jgi:hypothetical protein